MTLGYNVMTVNVTEWIGWRSQIIFIKAMGANTIIVIMYRFVCPSIMYICFYSDEYSDF